MSQEAGTARDPPGQGDCLRQTMGERRHSLYNRQKLGGDDSFFIRGLALSVGEMVSAGSIESNEQTEPAGRRKLLQPARYYYPSEQSEREGEAPFGFADGGGRRKPLKIYDSDSS